MVGWGQNDPCVINWPLHSTLKTWLKIKYRKYQVRSSTEWKINLKNWHRVILTSSYWLRVNAEHTWNKWNKSQQWCAAWTLISDSMFVYVSLSCSLHTSYCCFIPKETKPGLIALFPLHKKMFHIHLCFRNVKHLAVKVFGPNPPKSLRSWNMFIRALLHHSSTLWSGWLNSRIPNTWLRRCTRVAAHQPQPLMKMLKLWNMWSTIDKSLLSAI